MRRLRDKFTGERPDLTWFAALALVLVAIGSAAVLAAGSSDHSGEPPLADRGISEEPGTTPGEDAAPLPGQPADDADMAAATPADIESTPGDDVPDGESGAPQSDDTTPLAPVERRRGSTRRPTERPAPEPDPQARAFRRNPSPAPAPEPQPQPQPAPRSAPAPEPQQPAPENPPAEQPPPADEPPPDDCAEDDPGSGEPGNGEQPPEEGEPPGEEQPRDCRDDGEPSG